MVMDNNGMSHKAAGMVGGGQYESKAGSVTDKRSGRSADQLRIRSGRKTFRLRRSRT